MVPFIFQNSKIFIDSNIKLFLIFHTLASLHSIFEEQKLGLKLLQKILACRE